MRCNPWRWLWGVIPIAMLTWLACTWEREGIETDLRSRAEAALEGEGYAWGQVSLEGRDAFLTGVAPDESEPYRASETVRNVRGVRIVRSRTDARVAAAPQSPDDAGAAPDVQAIDPAPRSEGLSDAERTELQARADAAREHERRWRSEGMRAPAPSPRVAETEMPAEEPAAVEAEEPAAGDVSSLSDAERAEWEARWAKAREHERRWRSEGMRGPARAPRVAETEVPAEKPAATEAGEPAAGDMSPLSDGERADWEARWAKAREHERRWRGEGLSARATERDESARQRAEAEAEAKRREDEDAARVAEAERERVAAEEAKRREDEDAARAAEAERERVAAEEAKRREDEEAARAAEAERERVAAEEAKRRADEDAERAAEEQREQAAAEAEAQRLADEQAKAEQDAAEARRAEEEQAAAKRKAEEEEAAARRAEDAAETKRKEDQELAAAQQKDAEEAKRKAEADHCQGLMRSAMAEGMLNFARAKADITRDSYLTLDRLAGIAKVCPQARINIAGHTDSEGEPERNQGLSERRAKAIADYLVGKGVDPSRLKTEGFGETRPLAPNDTPDGMRQNRRIEFSVSPAS
jgi:OOP family OmpA-OmpF porin